MTSKRKYPKSFYDDGLGDFLEWIDDEVLIHERKPSNKRPINNSESESNDCKNKKLRIYGENDLEELLSKKEGKKESKLPTEEREDKKPDKKLEDRTRGLINRLAAQTMNYVCGEFKKLYSSQSRTELNHLIFSNIERSILMKSSVAKRKLVAELMLLVSYLSSSISHDIGASIVHLLIKQFETLYQDGSADGDKRLDNIVFCLVNLYSTGLISANIIFELTKRISEDFRSKSVELLLIILKNIGFQLRKENPGLMRKLVVMSYERCKLLESSSELDKRVEFILEAIAAIKNNNMSKIGNYGCDIDKDTIESTMKSLIKRTKLSESLSDATYGEILNSGNWFLLDTRLDETNEEPMKGGPKDDKAMASSKAHNKICKALGLNKPAERVIFSSLAKVSDYLEASNIVIGYGLNHCSDAMVVIMHVAIHEKKYNPFYFNVINNLSKFNRKYKMAAKFAMQDKIKVLGAMPSRRASILSRLCFELIQSDAMPITVLKSIEWANLSESTKEFVTYLLESISDLPEEEKRRIMLKSDRKSTFAGAMRTFSNCFLKGCQLFE